MPRISDTSSPSTKTVSAFTPAICRKISLEINSPWPNSKETFKYILAPKSISSQSDAFKANINTPIKNIVVSEINKQIDSTVVVLKTNPILKGVNLSVSVLPSSTSAYTSDNNIISKFLFNPYIKGDIENPWYYFDNTDREKNHDLDLLLLTQGWSKYSWINILFIFYHYHFFYSHSIVAGGFELIS